MLMWGVDYEKVQDYPRNAVRGSVEETLNAMLDAEAERLCNAYLAFPSEHWRRIRTNNPLERIMREIRRRTRVVGAFPDGESALNLCSAPGRAILPSLLARWCGRRAQRRSRTAPLGGGAISSLRASATTNVLRIDGAFAVRCRYHSASALLFLEHEEPHASWIMPRRTRALPERANPFSRRFPRFRWASR
jgi:hypothetical protein